MLTYARRVDKVTNLEQELKVKIKTEARGYLFKGAERRLVSAA